MATIKFDASGLHLADLSDSDKDALYVLTSRVGGDKEKSAAGFISKIYAAMRDASPEVFDKIQPNATPCEGSITFQPTRPPRRIVVNASGMIYELEKPKVEEGRMIAKGYRTWDPTLQKWKPWIRERYPVFNASQMFCEILRDTNGKAVPEGTEWVHQDTDRRYKLVRGNIYTFGASGWVLYKIAIQELEENPQLVRFNPDCTQYVRPAWEVALDKN